MSKRFRLFLQIAATAVFYTAAAQGAAGPQRPNIVFMLADDLGWRDTTPYGADFYETPNIERLARSGMRFTNAYSASPLCSPTRASILTGLYPGRLRLTAPVCHVPKLVLDPKAPDRAPPFYHVTVPGTRTRLPNRYVTVAEVLKQAGYRTAFMGKWHLGRAPYLPENQGFDVVVGGREHPGPPGGYFAPWPVDTIPKAPPGTHIDDVVTGEAVRFIEKNRNRSFFLCLWFYSVHAPFQAKERLVEKYRAKARKLGLESRRNPVMGAMIETLDTNVGRILDTLERLEIEKKTLVIFGSDNGGNEYDRVEGLPPTDNAPLRNGKGSIYDGGHRVPLIVARKGAIPAGAVCDAVVSSVDFFPTLLDLTGLSAPSNQILDGTTMRPLLEKRTGDTQRAIYCHFPHLVFATGSLPATSIRRGPWKLIRFYGDGPDRRDRFSLYDLSNDIGESKNLAASKPKLVRELNTILSRHLEATAALLPKLNPAYRPSVLGWRGNKQAVLSRGDGVMRVKSLGNDPWLTTTFFPPTQGRITVELEMRSRLKGPAAVYVRTRRNPRFHRSRMKSFTVLPDGKWHTYRGEFTLQSPLQAVRIDPATSKGEVEFRNIRILKWHAPGKGKTAHHWEF